MEELEQIGNANPEELKAKVEELRKRTEATPSDSLSWFLLGIALLRSEDIENAFKAFESGAASKSGENEWRAKCIERQILILQASGRLEEAVSLIDLALAEQSEKPNMFLALTRINLASELKGDDGVREAMQILSRYAEHPALRIFESSILQSEGDVGAAAAVFKELSTQPTHEFLNDEAALWAIGLARANCGDLEGAYQAAELMVAAEGEVTRSHVCYLQIAIPHALSKGRWDAAKQMAVQFGAIAPPENPLPHLWQAEALIGLEDYDEALKAADKAINVARKPMWLPVRIAARSEKGAILILLGRAEDAQKELADAMREDSTRPTRDLFSMLAYTNASMAEYLMGAKETAEEYIGKAVEISASLPSTTPRRGLSLLVKASLRLADSRYDEALNAINASIALEPGQIDALLAKAQTHASLEEYRMASQIAQQAAVVDGPTRTRIDAWLVCADAHIELHAFEEAIAALRQAIDLEPDDFRVWSALGEAYRKLGRRKAAVYALGRAWELVPKDTKKQAAKDAALALTSAHLEANEPQKALDFIDHSEAVLTEEKHSIAEFEHNRGLAYYQLKDYRAAVRVLRNASKLGVPDSGDLADRVAEMQSGTGSWTDYWFASTTTMRRKATGASLLLLLLAALSLSVLETSKIECLTWLRTGAHLPIIATFAALLLLPVVRKLKIGSLELEPIAGKPQTAPSSDQIAIRALSAAVLTVTPNT